MAEENRVGIAIEVFDNGVGASFDKTTEGLRQVDNAVDETSSKIKQTASMLKSQLSEIAMSSVHTIAQYMRDAATLPSTRLNRGEIDFSEYEAMMKQNTDSYTSLFDSVADGFERMKNGFRAIGSLQKKAFLNSGILVTSEQYKELERQIDKTEKSLELLENTKRISEEANPNFNQTVSYKRMSIQIDETKGKIQELINKREELARKGKDVTFNIKGFENKVSIYKKSVDDFKKSIDGVNTAIRKKISNLLALFNPLKKVTDSSKKLSLTNKGLARELMRTAKMLRLMVVRMALRGVIDGTRDGFKNVAKYSDKLNESMTRLMNANTQLKNSFGAMIAPLVNALAPALVYIIGLITQAINVLNQLFSVFTGGTTWLKAKIGTDDYRDSLDKANGSAKKLKNTILGFDELNVLNGDDKSGGGGGTDASGLFEELPIDDRWKNFADWLKEMWSKGDFYQLGKMLGEKLKEALDNIPWDEIKAMARKIAHSIATLINGFIEVEGLGTSIGKTLAEAFNTAFEFINEFVHTLRWSSVGQFIGDTLNGIFDNIDWKLIEDTFITGFTGLADAINFFVYTFKWDNLSESIANVVNIVARTINAFFERIDLDYIGQSLGKELRKSIEKIDWQAVGRAIGNVIQSAINFIAGFLNGLDWNTFKNDVKNALQNAFKGLAQTLDFEEVTKIIVKLLAIKMAINVAAGSWGLVGNAVKTALISAINEKLYAAEAVSAFGTIGKAIGGFIGDAVFGGIILVLGTLGIQKVVQEVLNHFSSLDGAERRNGEMVDYLKERYEGLAGAFNIWVDAKTALDNFFHGFGLNASNAVGTAGALEQAWNKVNDGFILSDDYLNGLRERFQVTEEDIDSLTQAMFDMHPELLAFADEFGSTAYQASLLEKELPGVVEKIDEAGSTMTTTSNTVKTTTDEIKSSFDATAENTVENCKKIKNSVFENWEKSSKKTEEEYGKMEKHLELSWGNMEDTTDESTEAIVDKIELEFGGDNMEDALSEIEPAFDTAFEKSTDSVEKQLNKMSGIVSSIIDGIKNTIAGIASAIANVISSIRELNNTKINDKGHGGTTGKYAAGGFPSMGEIFVAREAGPEMVGTIGNHTAVANNQQIENGIANAVYRAMMSVAQSGSFGGGDVVVNAILKTENDEVLARAVTRGQKSIDRRYNVMA